MNISYSTKDILSPEFFSFQSIIPPLDYHLHSHYSMEIIFSDNCELEIIINGSAHRISPQEGILIPPFFAHSIATKHILSSEGKIRIFMITPELVPDFQQQLEAYLFRSYRFFLPSEAQQLLLQLPFETIYEKKALAYFFISCFMKNNSTLSQSNEYTQDNFQKIIDYLIRHHTEPLSLQCLSQQFGIHPVTVCKMFQRHLSQSFHDVLSNIRISHTIRLLISQDTPISQIAFECGFGSLRNFNRVFLKLVGCTPSEYRQGHSNAP